MYYLSRSKVFTPSFVNKDVTDSSERSENNLLFVRHKCDEWLENGLPKLARLRYSIDEHDLVIEKEWKAFLTEQTASVKN
jgi:hypothetical protein